MHRFCELTLDSARAAMAAGAFCLSGCALGLLDAAPTPMREQVEFVDEAHPSRCLVVFFPGVLDGDGTFEEHGFPRAMAARHVPTDWVAVNATLGYYTRRTVAERVRDDVLRPLRSRHYRQIWLVGVSMGGFGAVLVGRDQGSRIAGMVLISPFLGDLGDHGLLTEIDDAGGLFKWDAAPVANEDDQREGWRFLKHAAEHPEGPPVVYLASAHHDPLNYGHRLLGEALPPERVIAIDGDHEWLTFERLWEQFLDDSNFLARCAR
jgi:pimeloyl-ACP methyl ester carboxylesterase